MKLFVFCCLVCYALAYNILLSNENVECNFHAKYETDSPDESFEYFGVFNTYGGTYISSSPRLAKIVFGSGLVQYLRCDERDDKDNCYVKTYNQNDPAGTCQDAYDSPYLYSLPHFPMSFEYDGTQYPKDTDCPDKKSTGCELYCDDQDEPECIVVDAEGRFVKEDDGSVWTFLEPVTMDVFEVDKCNPDAAHPHLSAPGNLCEALTMFEPAELDCAFHIKKEGSYSSEEYYGISIDGKPFMAKDISQYSTTLVRCDDKQDNDCYTKTTDDEGSCTEMYQSFINWYWPSFSKFEYDSLDYPKPADCPDNGQGCQKYCTDYMEESCIIVDASGHIVLDENGAKWTYFDSPSMEVFKDTKCDDPTIELPTPPDYCTELAKIYPNFPECKFHIQTTGGSFPVDAYVVIVNGSVTMLSINAIIATMLLRCDMQDDNGNCYKKTSMALFSSSCADGFDVQLTISADSIMPESFSYNKTLYPVDAECPDHSACKKYCDVFGECALVDANGYFVKHGEEVTTYSSDFSMDVFNTVRCDGTSLPSVSIADPCQATGSQSSSTTSTPGAPSSTPGAPSSPAKPSANPSALSSASVADAAFTLVAFAIAVALLL